MDNNKNARTNSNSAESRCNNKNQARPKGSAKNNASSSARKSSR